MRQQVKLVAHNIEDMFGSIDSSLLSKPALMALVSLHTLLMKLMAVTKL